MTEMNEAKARDIVARWLAEFKSLSSPYAPSSTVTSWEYLFAGGYLDCLDHGPEVRALREAVEGARISMANMLAAHEKEVAALTREIVSLEEVCDQLTVDAT